MKISESEYKELLSFAKHILSGEKEFLFNEYDLVHEAICRGENDTKAAIKKFFHSERLKQKADRAKSSPQKSSVRERACKICKDILPESAFYKKFDNRLNLHYLDNICITCRSLVFAEWYNTARDTPAYIERQMAYMLTKYKKRRQRYANKIKDTLLIGFKHCTKCKDELPPRAFGLYYTKKYRRYYLSVHCLQCDNIKSHDYYHSVKDTQQFKKKAQARNKANWASLKASPKKHSSQKARRRRNHAKRMKDPARRKKELKRSRQNNATHRQRMKDDQKYAEQYRAKRRAYDSVQRAKKKKLAKAVSLR